MNTMWGKESILYEDCVTKGEDTKGVGSKDEQLVITKVVNTRKTGFSSFQVLRSFQ